MSTRVSVKSSGSSFGRFLLGALFSGLSLIGMVILSGFTLPPKDSLESWLLLVPAALAVIWTLRGFDTFNVESRWGRWDFTYRSERTFVIFAAGQHSDFGKLSRERLIGVTQMLLGGFGVAGILKMIIAASPEMFLAIFVGEVVLSWIWLWNDWCNVGRTRRLLQRRSGSNRFA